MYPSILQNPKNCNKAKKLVCNLNKGCGYGCQLHHVVYCFMIAYGTERTMILESRGWRYSSGGWDKVFKPVSDTCRTRPGGSSRSWGGEILMIVNNNNNNNNNNNDIVIYIVPLAYKHAQRRTTFIVRGKMLIST